LAPLVLYDNRQSLPIPPNGLYRPSAGVATIPEWVKSGSRGWLVGCPLVSQKRTSPSVVPIANVREVPSDQKFISTNIEI
jgi:hypothetical protein